MFRIRSFDAPLGAEVIGLDLGQPLADADFRRVIEAFHDRSLLVFRDQKITPEQHIAFSKRLGELQVHIQSTYHLAGYPEIYSISNVVDENGKPIGLADAGKVWHTDLSYMDRPSRCSLLYAHEVPRDDDGKPLGDTLFASTIRAYAALPEATRKRIAGLRAVHSYLHIFDKISAKKRVGAANLVPLTEEQKKKVPDVTHPVVITHPHTRELTDHAIRPEFVYRHSWREGDLLMWDNISTQHLAMHDYALPRRRRMHRTTVQGPAPVYDPLPN
jgi:taurine dioxygenase